MITWKRFILVQIAALICAPVGATGENYLAEAMKALESGNDIKALELSAARQSNPWLEIYRLYVRAEAFLAAGDSASAGVQAVSASEMLLSGEVEGHPEGGRLLDIAIISGGSQVAPPCLPDELLESLSPLSLLLMGRRCFLAGDSCAASLCLKLASHGTCGIDEVEIISGITEDGILTDLTVPIEIIADFTSAAISAGDDEAAHLLTGMVDSTGEYSWLADILEADLLASSGKKSKALTLYRSVFRSSTCPVEGKKKALQRIASLQYRMKRLSRSADSYRMYGLYYPDDPLAEMSTDRAARIELASGRWDAAVDTWMRIADRGPETLTGREAILGLAVSLERMGRNGDACRVLKDGLRSVRGRLRAGYLYWIVRTCDDEQVRSQHAMMLREEFASSIYSRALDDETGFLIVSGARSEGPGTSRLELILRMKPFPWTGTAADQHSLEAFRYFAGEGIKTAASDCARSFLTATGGMNGSNATGMIYREAKEAGIERLCLELAVANPDLFDGRDDYIEFLYPFAFGTEVDKSSGKHMLPPEIVLAVIREESRFDENIMSPAGAWGLMQIMPSTGKWIGRKIGRKEVSTSDLRDPDFNIAAGCWYLRFLLDRADGSMVAALAAYNAGHGRMRTWKRKFSPQTDPLGALELIGPSETRRYVRRVLDSMAMYGRQIASHTR